MEAISEFFSDKVLFPLYYYIAGYAGVWFLAFILARLFSAGKRILIDLAVSWAWGIALTLHIIIGIILIFNLIAHLQILQLLLYFFFVVVDVIISIFLVSRWRELMWRYE